jgi:menaquinone-dependent protoporphyrinogen oxidase
VLEPEQVDEVEGYDAVVLGSAVYAGHRLKPARKLVDRCGAALAARPVWLFSSGPVGDPPKPEEDPDWAEITGWAAGIATALRSPSPAEAGHDERAG